MIKLEPLTNQEAADFWADKAKVSPSQFRKLTAEAKVKAFAVAGIARGAELDSMFNALQKAIDKGVSFKKFKDEVAAIAERRGWTGPRARRLDTIFRTNIQTAYNVGRYRQMLDTVATRPYWQYSAVNDSRTRPTHAAMDGKIFPHDHPFWDKWYPPNGFRCRCGVVSLSEDDVRDEGLKVETQDPTGRLIEPVDPTTGARMPARQLMPDPGFKHHPGKSYWGPVGEALQDNLEKWPAPIGIAVVRDMVSGAAFRGWYEMPQGRFPVGRLKQASADAIGAKVLTVSLSAETAIKQAKIHPELSSAEYAKVQAAIDHGYEIQDGAHSLIYVLEEDRGYVSVVKSTRTGGAVFLTSFRRLSRDKVKRSEEVKRLLKKGKKQQAL